MIYLVMSTDLMSRSEFESAIEATASELVHRRKVAGSHFINLPLLYPDGSSVTVRIDRVIEGLRVSDNGFAYREIEALGAESSFKNTARNIVEEIGVQVNRRMIYAEATPDTLYRAISDVATASWRIASQVAKRVSEQEEAEIEEQLTARLASIFGRDHVRAEKKLTGASSSEWEVSAVVSLEGRIAAFQAVGDRPISIYRTATAFHDLASLEKPPILIAVVRSKKALGSRLGLLSQAGRVIEERQSDDVFRRAAA
jgi:hypothetical protein